MDHAQSSSLLEHGLQPGDSENMLRAGTWLVEHVITGASAFCLHLHPNSLRIQLYVAARDVKTENKGGKDESP